MNKIIARHYDIRVLHPSRTRLILGLLLFALTYPLTPTVVEDIPYAYQHGGLGVLLNIGGLWATFYTLQIVYFLPGMVLASIFLWCLRFWLRHTSSTIGWLQSACIVSLALAVSENLLLLLICCDGDIRSGWTRYTLGFLISSVVGLFLSGVLSACYWVKPSWRTNG